MTESERTAPVQRDIEALYAIGVHLFLLFTWLVPILEHEVPDFGALQELYAEAIERHGRPNWRT